MTALLSVIRYVGLAVFAVSMVFVLIVLMNALFGFAEVQWLQMPFLRLYLFFAVIGILGYILVTFRRREGNPK